MLTSRLDKVQKDCEHMIMNNDQLASENMQRVAELKSKDEEISGLKKELARVSKIREALQRKLRQVDEQKMESEQRRESLKQQIQGMEKEIETSKKMAEANRRNYDDLIRERETTLIKYVRLDPCRCVVK